MKTIPNPKRKIIKRINELAKRKPKRKQKDLVL